jgi:hypothetical protein
MIAFEQYVNKMHLEITRGRLMIVQAIKAGAEFQEINRITLKVKELEDKLHELLDINNIRRCN